MNFRIDMSAGALFDLVRPAVIVISILVSIWVVASARKRFRSYQAIAWAAGTVFLPLIVFPLYLITLLVVSPRPVQPKRCRFLLPLIYGAVALVSGGAYFYVDTYSVDAYLARATQAKLVEDRATAIREYQRALALEDNPHTHKLLAIELSESGFWSDAISELRLAEEGGEPDDSIHYRLGLLLDLVNQSGQAREEFQRFLFSDTCRNVDPRCEDARRKLEEDNR